MNELEQEIWKTRLEWAESSDHPIATTIRLAARMALEKTDEDQDRPSRQVFQSMGEDER